MTALLWLEKTFLYIMIYAFAGWVYETIICSLEARRLVERGFFNGPYCPIYGFGAMLDVYALGWTDNVFLLFFLGMALDTILEYATSYVMEVLFHARWWDYSTYRFNINGRVCLLGAVVFGAFSTVVVLVIHPAVEGLVALLPMPALHSVAAVLFALFVVDAVITVRGLAGFDEKLRELTSEVEAAVTKRAHEVGVVLSEAVEKAAEKVGERTHGIGGALSEAAGKVGGIEKSVAEAIHEAAASVFERFSKRLNSTQSRMIRSFPHLRSVSYENALSGLRRYVVKNKKTGAESAESAEHTENTENNDIADADEKGK